MAAPPTSDVDAAPGGELPGSEAVRFATLVKAVAVEARRLGLEVPGFRSPPRLAGVDRTLRRRPGGSPSVAVRLAGRADPAVAADLVEGVVVANQLSPAAAAHARRRLLAAVPGAAPAAGQPTAA